MHSIIIQLPGGKVLVIGSTTAIETPLHYEMVFWSSNCGTRADYELLIFHGAIYIWEGYNKDLTVSALVTRFLQKTSGTEYSECIYLSWT